MYPAESALRHGRMTGLTISQRRMRGNQGAGHQPIASIRAKYHGKETDGQDCGPANHQTTLRTQCAYRYARRDWAAAAAVAHRPRIAGAAGGNWPRTVPAIPVAARLTFCNAAALPFAVGSDAACFPVRSAATDPVQIGTLVLAAGGIKFLKRRHYGAPELKAYTTATCMAAIIISPYVAGICKNNQSLSSIKFAYWKSYGFCHRR